MQTPQPHEPSERERWNDVQEHVWRGAALAHVLTELFWATEQGTLVTETHTYIYVRPKHFRIVAEMLSEVLDAAIDGLGDMELM